MTQRAALYARVSSDDTRNDGRNLDGQLEMCRTHALSKGWHVVHEFREDDRGASGVSMDLPALTEMMAMARAGSFDIIVVREIDRFSRTLAKQLIIEEQLKKYGVRIEYVLGEYPDTPEGNLMKHIKASISEYERLKILERMTRGRYQRVKSGKLMLHGNPAPYGYRVNQDETSLEICEPEARVIRMIFEWYVYGDETHQRLGRTAIATRLTQMRIPTWADIHEGISIGKKAQRCVWHPGTISTMLKNPVYGGWWVYARPVRRVTDIDDMPYKIEVPKIIGPELWEAAQTQLNVNQRMARRNTKYEYLLRGMITCGCCGNIVRGRAVSRSSKEKKYFYYTCKARITMISGVKCNLPDFRVWEVDAAVWEWIEGVMSNAGTLEKGLAAFRAEQEAARSPIVERMAVVEGLIAENRAALERLVDLYVQGSVPRDLISERSKRIESTIEGLNTELANLAQRLQVEVISEDQFKQVQEFLTTVSSGLQEARGDFAMRRRIVEQLDVRATFSVENGERVIAVLCMLGKGVLSIEAKGCQTSRMGTGSSRQLAYSAHNKPIEFPFSLLLNLDAGAR